MINFQTLSVHCLHYTVIHAKCKKTKDRTDLIICPQGYPYFIIKVVSQRHRSYKLCCQGTIKAWVQNLLEQLKYTKNTLAHKLSTIVLNTLEYTVEFSQLLQQNHKHIKNQISHKLHNSQKPDNISIAYFVMKFLLYTHFSN